MARDLEREVWTKVIELFRELSYLYEKKHKDYPSRDKRKQGYKMLLDEFNARTNYRDITMAEFKKKLENMRTSYARELKKVIASRQTASGSNDVYSPSLWYYYLFDFLEGEMEPYCTRIDPLEETEEPKPEVKKRVRNELPPAFPAETSNPKNQRMTLQPRMFGTAQTMMARTEEEWEITGKSLGLQMRDLDKQQIVFVQKIISDAIYYGKMGKLTEESHITL